MAALMVDSLILFSKQINGKLGKDVKRLFNIEEVHLNKTEIYIKSQKGIECSYEKNITEPWPLGNLVLSNILNVSHYSISMT